MPGQASGQGVYEGVLEIVPLDDGRRVRLGGAFTYVDKAGLRWTAPAGAVVDGASVPQASWTLTDGPFGGRYRNAWVIHDWYCDRRSRPWRDVHRMFHEAMLASGIEPIRAKLMYAAVYWGGPRWSDAGTAPPSAAGSLFRPDRASASQGSPRPPARFAFDRRDLAQLQALIGGRDPDLARIDRLVDETLQRRGR